jgi:hypothetical protein
MKGWGVECGVGSMECGRLVGDTLMLMLMLIVTRAYVVRICSVVAPGLEGRNSSITTQYLRLLY